MTETTVAAAIAGDESAFAALTERHRRELHVHCIRPTADARPRLRRWMVN